MQLDDDSALALYRSARSADPGYFVAQHEYVSLMLYRFRGPELQREFQSGDTAAALNACLLAASRIGPDDARPFRRLKDIEARVGPTQCTDAFLLPSDGGYSPERAQRAMRDSPQLLEVISAVAGALGSSGRWRDADALLLAAIASADNPLTKQSLMRSRATYLLARSDTNGARAIWRSIEQHARRDGRPGLMADHLTAYCIGPFTIPDANQNVRDASCARFLAFVRKLHAPASEWETARWFGKALMERGDLAAAAPVLARVVHLADSLGIAGLQLHAYTLRGRLHVKSGQLAPALRDLRRATSLGQAAGLPYYLAEAYHNLAHAYEGGRRLTEAAAMADTFASIAATLPGSSLRWSARHDAGTIRWSAGLHAAAARDFEEMVRIIDELGNDGHAFAGEYFERIGNLGRALHYYRIGARLPHPDPRNLAALSRVYEAIGMPDSAEAAARMHDANSHRWPITEQPLLPDLLARQGRLREAVELSDGWARSRLVAGNVEGAALAHLKLAELQLSAQNPRAAYAAALRADSLRRRLQLASLAASVRTLMGRALFEEGRRDSGIALLRQASRIAAEADRSTEATLSSNLALGNALVSLNRRSEAVAAYDRAAVAVERMTAGLDADQHRAAFKARHIAPFNGALLILAANGAPDNAAMVLRWSERRKAAALKLAGPETYATPRAPSLDLLRQRLAPDEALLDFTLLDSLVVAVIVRRQQASVRILSVSTRQLATWIDAIRRPLVAAPGGSIDLAHARFDIAAAESLYRALILPFDADLRGMQRLTIAPDGALWYVPFAAMVIGRNAAATPRGRMTYAVERFEMRLLPSAAFLSAQRPRLPPRFRVSAFGYDVEGFARELSAIGTALGPERVALYEGAAATERAALSASTDVLHFAVHGILDDRDPLASHLRLSPDRENDGLLHLPEVASRRHVARVVVLTACEAVSGKQFSGEGLVSLARAFLLGGAEQVVASSWPVNASASTLSAVLYNELSSGRTVPAALRAAQLALLSARATAHPLHWAGFVAFEAARRR